MHEKRIRIERREEERTPFLSFSTHKKLGEKGKKGRGLGKARGSKETGTRGIVGRMVE